MFDIWRRNSIIKRYADVLPRIIARNFGQTATYTPDQILMCAQEGWLPRKYIRFGYAMFLDRDGFNSVPRQPGEVDMYERLRKEIASYGYVEPSPVTSDTQGFDWTVWVTPVDIFWSDGSPNSG